MASSGINSQHCRHETTAAREIITNRTVRHDIWAIPALIRNCLCRRKSGRRRSETGATPKHERNAAPLLRRKKALARSLARSIARQQSAACRMMKPLPPPPPPPPPTQKNIPPCNSPTRFIPTYFRCSIRSITPNSRTSSRACQSARPPSLTFSRERGEGEERDKSIIPFPTSSLPPSHPLLSYLPNSREHL